MKILEGEAEKPLCSHCTKRWRMEDKSPDVVLDPNCWGKLHPELVEQVLYKLPYSSLVKFRSVCKHWKDLIQCFPLAPKCRSPKSVLLYHHSGGIRGHNGIWMGALLAFFNSKTNTWERRSLPFLGTRSFVASDEGLLCFSSKYEPEKFIVCNPLTKQWRELKLPSSVLPPIPRGAAYKNPFNYMLMGMIMNKETGHYKLVIAGFHEAGPSKSFIYDSSKSTWNVSAPLPLLPTTLNDGEWICAGKSVCCNGNLYWFVHEIDDNHEQGVKALVKFNVEKEEWKVAQEAAPSPFFCSFQVAAQSESVVLVDWEDDQYWGYVNGGPTELLELGSEMRLMDAKMVDLAFIDEETQPVWSVGQGELLYIVYDYGPQRKGLKVLVYDQSKGSITWLPPWRHLREHKSFWAFTPSLRAFV
ncbi:hypothetical protein MPTK1_1g21780 [Marchantia polymorpha subsp. ruderalis]|uniref:F-box domain-containing protein n=2 Tax=Marchantia polymorpha TaxID=3197 RepID=A0AAF6ASU2_MARPO|nr:hypothetical protein MARPO_0001s0513 [Marchantia polymorpha]BBM99512.1 hypothetical protein Mp_1g21780 [Marchantia polymorpha subsp. ruderalis]|eukprot:PTQ50594.1 hypothetical protein MARPO_0001s0513 [Marchantia polymorpha]